MQVGKRKIGRARHWLMLLTLGGLSMATIGMQAAPPVHAASIVSEKVLLGMWDNQAVPQPGVRSHVPGVTRGAKIWADTYVTSSLARYAGLKFSLWTRYRGATATAIEFAKYRDGKTADCLTLNSYDGKGQIDTLYDLACNKTPAGNAKRPNYWCAAEAKHQAGATEPPQVDTDLNRCPGPRPLGWASWHNQHVKIATVDVYEELGLKFLPGHLNLDTYVEDFEMLSGVANLDNRTLQPVSGDTSFKGYGKTLTAGVANQWAHMFVSLAKSAGYTGDWTTHPIDVYNAAERAITYDRDHPAHTRVIDMSPTPINAYKYKNQLHDLACAWSPWIADSVDPNVNDASGKLLELGFPVDVNANAPNNMCMTHFHFWRYKSSYSIGRTLQDFVYRENDGVVPKDLREKSAFIPMIIQEAMRNRDKVNPLVIYGPQTLPGTTKTTCAAELNLGVSRGTPLNPDGTLNVDVWDPHFRNLIRQLGDVLG